ncbi:MAG: TatD family hydrolase [Chitinophagales bacterium]|nr:TatD family hydrolase [Bacteroidota bacterium]MCB9044200.1 TatD family hydrolase [Chitinophagales bacterium]
MLTDTHTHLFSKEFSDETAYAHVQRAIDAGVEKMFMPNVDLSTIAAMNQIAATFPNNCFSMIGLHPCSVEADFEEKLAVLAKELAQQKYYGIGETGLDYYWDTTFTAQQKQSLTQHARWAKQYQIPIILHTRNAFADTLAIMQSENNADLRGIFHCFSENAAAAQEVIALGDFYIGIGGVITFKKNTELAETVAATSLEHIVLETDAPYLAPTPYRGKRNESAYLPLIAQKIAEIKAVSIAEVIAQTSRNAQKLFGINK